MATCRYLAGELLVTLCVLNSGCNWSEPSDPVLEVNDQNCLPENSGRIKNFEARKKFVEKCVQMIEAKPRSIPRGW